jgi:ParB/RepB/Spo0J family partition protein
MEIKELDIDKIKIGERYRYDLGDIESFAASIKEVGILQPITVDSKLNLLAGGRRLAAAKEAGLRKIPAVIRGISGEVDARLIELIENVQRKDLEWTEQAMLEKRIFDLNKEADPNWRYEDQATLMGKSAGAIHRRVELAGVMEDFPTIADHENQEAAWKAYHKLKEDVVAKLLVEQSPEEVQKAHRWAKDHYKIGDALEGMAKVNDGICLFAEVDPPYAIDLKKAKDRAKGTDTGRYNEIAPKEYKGFIEGVAKEVYRILGDNTFCVWWFGMTWYKIVQDVLTKQGFKVSDIPAIWVKGIGGQTASPDTMLASSYETFFIARKGSPKLRTPGKSNVFSFAPVPPQHKIHPTEKPIALILDIIDTCVYPGSIILCPFLGSGVTLRAAYMRSMKGFGWDFDEVAKRRFADRVARDFLEEEEQENAQDNSSSDGC